MVTNTICVNNLNTMCKIFSVGSQRGCDFLLTHTPFVPCQLATPLQRFNFFSSKFDPENPRSRSWMRSKFKVTKWAFLLTHSFCSMSIVPPIPEIQLFPNLILKIKGQGHGRVQISKPQSIPLPTDSFVSCHRPSYSYDTAFVNSWPWKSKVKVTNPWCCTTTDLYNSIEIRTV